LLISVRKRDEWKIRHFEDLWDPRQLKLFFNKIKYKINYESYV